MKPQRERLIRAEAGPISRIIRPVIQLKATVTFVGRDGQVVHREVPLERRGPYVRLQWPD